MRANKKILVTGGAGYIGSHVTVELLAAGLEPLLLDNFSNSSPATLSALAKLTGRSPIFFQGDIRDPVRLNDIFGRHDFHGVIHLGGLKSPSESHQAPLRYYENNFAGVTTLLERMAHHEVKSIVFSSSAAVYASSENRLDENAPTAPKCPYARTKLAVEEMLRDLYDSDPSWNISILRYFNAGGAHPSGLIGEYATGVPQNLLPRIAKVAADRHDRLDVFGDAHPTPDGTCVRDYVHVIDIARAHVLACKRMTAHAGFSVYNLGSGRGHSVLEVIRAFEHVNGVHIPYRIVHARPGEAAMVRSDPCRAQKELGWTAELQLDRICADLWHRSGSGIPQYAA